MKSHQKIILLFLFAVAASCVVSPLAKIAADSLTISRPGMAAKLLEYDEGKYDFGKLYRRLLMAFTIAAFLVFHRKLNIASLATVGLRRKEGCWRQLAWGAALGVGSMLILILVMLLLDGRRFELDFDSGAELGGKLLKYAIGGLLVGVIEEMLFRGFILQSFMKDMRVWSAVVATSAIYALLHFFQGDVEVSSGFDALIGVKALGVFFGPMMRPLDILPATMGLFLVGVALSYAYIETGSLYLPIGLHAAWVFGMKASKRFVGRTDGAEWLFGDAQIVTGVLGWLFLIGMIAVLRLTLKRQRSAMTEAD